MRICPLVFFCRGGSFVIWTLTDAFPVSGSPRSDPKEYAVVETRREGRPTPRADPELIQIDR
jgi:hypothetical protein